MKITLDDEDTKEVLICGLLEVGIIDKHDVPKTDVKLYRGSGGMLGLSVKINKEEK